MSTVRVHAAITEVVLMSHKATARWRHKDGGCVREHVEMLHGVCIRIDRFCHGTTRCGLPHIGWSCADVRGRSKRVALSARTAYTMLHLHSKSRSTMSRTVLEEARIHPGISERMAEAGAEIEREVEAAVAQHDVVVVGMAQNPFPRKARRLLDARGVPYIYLEYGSYFSAWRRRLTLKLWTGWTTYPMIFVKGVLIGGASELAALLASGELDMMLCAT